MRAITGRPHTRYQYLLRLTLVVLALGLGACRAFSREDTYGTLEAQNALYGTEIAAITQVAALERVNVVSTVDASQQQLAMVNAVNESLLATLQVVVTPTPALVVDQALGGDSVPADLGDRRWFVPTGIASTVRESDGCADQTQTRFSTDTERIYATLRAYNLDQGTPITVQWYRENELRWEETWTVDQNYREICVWFYIDPSIVEFTPGSWATRLFADGFRLETPLPFSIGDGGGAEDMMDG